MRWSWLWLAVGLAACGQLRAAELPAFQVGEKLYYRIFWGPVMVGEATLEVRGMEPVEEQDCYHIVARARTAGLGRLLFKLDSVSESWLDAQGLFSRRFKQDRQEGRHSKRAITDFDYRQQTAITRNLVNGREQRTAIAGPVQDIISSLYYVRAQPLALHRQEAFTLNASDKNWNVTFQPDKRQRMEVRPVGSVQALRVEPQPTLKFVANNNGRMWFWVSDDHRRIPLVVSSTMAIGTAKLILNRIDQPPHRTAAQAPASVVIAATH